MTRLVHEVGNGAHKLLIILREKRDCAPLPASSSRSADAVNVGNKTLWEVKIDNLVDSFKVDSSAHEVSADQNPGLPKPKSANSLITLLLLFVSVDNVDVEAVELQLLKQLLCSVFRLSEDQHWWLKAILDLLAEGS